MSDRRQIFGWAGFIVFFALSGLTIQAAQAADPVGRVASTYGTTWQSTGGGTDWRPIGRGAQIFPGDRIRTNPRSGASLVMDDETLIRLGPSSNFEAEEVAASSFWRRATALVSNLTGSVRSTFKLLGGRMWLRNNNRDVNTRVVTTAATIGIRGTELVIEADGETSHIEIQEGSALATSGDNETLVVPGERVTAVGGLGFSRSTIVRQRDAVQWTVAIPPIVNLASLIADSARTNELERLFAAADYDAMSRIINQQDGADTRLALSAWVDLHSGASGQAYRSLSQRMAAGTAPVGLRELAAFAAIVNGDAVQAGIWLAALETEGLLSANGRIVGGYLSQADYDLPGAIASYRKALALDPANDTARLQLARVLFGSDRSEAATAEVRRVLANNPDNPGARNLLGFLQLANLDTLAAAATWEGLGDQADADTHFGLGLAYMRQGRTDAAFENMATAVALDPQRSLYLSYWGKMLYQVGRYDKAMTVLDSAVRLDPEDPTPRLYRAIILRDLHRPGDAITEIQAAVKLNGNRGVYRSRSLLDKDSAVQNVDLSLLYNQLGLSRWAHSRATASVKADYRNVSAHILNAGAFANMDEYSYPLASSALLARMLQPANINAFSSFNSYTTLFEAPETQQLVEVGAGNHGQASLTYAAWGANPDSHTAWTLAAVHESSDGWRDDNGDEFNDIAFIGKWQPDRENNYLLTATVFESTFEGDPYPRYEIDFDPYPQAEFRSTSLLLELGWHRRLSSDHDMLLHLSMLGNEGEITANSIENTTPAGSTQEVVTDGDFKQPSALLQFQGIFHKGQHQLFYGALSSSGDDQIDVFQDRGFFNPDGSLNDPLILLDEQVSNNLDTAYRGIYLQDSWAISPRMQLDMALYHETIENTDALFDGKWTIEETSPRLGLAIEFGSGQRLRLAAFRYLLPVAFARLDPIDVAGVPVFRNAKEGSLVDEVDVVWEYEWARGLVTASAFSLEREYTGWDAINQVESTSEGDKQGGRLTGDFLLGRRSGLALELESFEASDEALPAADRDELRLRLNFAHVLPSGVTLAVEQIQRELAFDSDRDDESIAVTNLRGSWQFDDRRQRVSVEALNLFDAEFNWVTDEFSTGGIAPARLLMARYLVQF